MNPDFTKEQALSSAVAGVLGTVAFAGFFASIGNTGVVKGAIPALYGLSPSLPLGMAIHLFHGAVLGVVYALIISNTSYGHHLDEVKKATAWGLGYGALTTLLLAGLLMPVWLASVGFPKAPSVPNLSVNGLIGHMIYGAVLGASYPLIKNQLE